MEPTQATQTFLLFYFIFILGLVGFLIFIKNSKKIPEISLSNSVQTSILLVGIFTLIVFGASYYFVLSDADPTKQPLKDALSITASFFGGFTTLTAAYIASKLFNDWREQPKLEIKLKLNKNKNLIIKLILELRSGNYNPAFSDKTFNDINNKLNEFNKITNEISNLIDEYEISSGTNNDHNHIYDEIKSIIQQLKAYPPQISLYFQIMKNIMESGNDIDNESDSVKEIFMEGEKFLHPNLISMYKYRDENGCRLLENKNIGKEIVDLLNLLSEKIIALK